MQNPVPDAATSRAIADMNALNVRWKQLGS